MTGDLKEAGYCEKRSGSSAGSLCPPFSRITSAPADAAKSHFQRWNLLDIDLDLFLDLDLHFDLDSPANRHTSID